MTNLSSQTKEEFFASHGVEDEQVVRPALPYNVDCIYSIFDTCALTYDAPFLAVSDSVAIRQIKDVISMRDTILKRHPEDYQLFKLGSLDKSTGVLYPERMPLRILNLIELFPKS